ncbi:hypothetical protein ROLI_014980 [Roseobacter fucihabitans]|uniref:Uncharacterized protein n=1 Tax=Roseobacter fucihabitans TaxID=1537242 RepID=A0ABZ2BRU4_9RHOB
MLLLGTLVVQQGAFLVSVRQRRCVMLRTNESGATSRPDHRAGRWAGFGQLAPYKDFLIGIIRAEPDITLHALSGALEDTSGVSVHLS